MKHRSLPVVAIAILASLLVPAGSVFCASTIQMFSGYDRCCYEFHTDSPYIMFPVWVWIYPGEDGVQSAEFRLDGCTNIITTGSAFGPGVTALGGDIIRGYGIEIAVEPCRTEPFLAYRLDMLPLSTAPCYLIPGPTLGGALSVVTCSGQTEPLEIYSYFPFNSGGCACGISTPTPSTCQQIEPDRIRVVFRSRFRKYCGEDYPHYSVFMKDGIDYTDTLDLIDADFDTFNCQDAFPCDSIVAVFTFDQPLDPDSEYLFSLDGLGLLEMHSCGKRFIPIERLNTTTALLLPTVPLTLSNHPNPFNPFTEIVYSLPAAGLVDLSIYDVNGKLVRRLIERVEEAGTHSAEWDGRGADGDVQPSGVYFCRLSLGKAEVTSKLVLLR